MKRKSGFTLVELLGVITLVAVLGTMSFGVINGMREASEEVSAITRAQALNASKSQYKLRVRGAAAAWASAASDTDRYALLSGASVLPTMAPSTFSAYVPSGYTFNLGATLDTPIGVTGPHGAVNYNAR